KWLQSPFACYCHVTLNRIMMWKRSAVRFLANVYNNKNFNALPVDQPMLQAALTDFTASIAATVQGGSQATNEKNKKKHELVALLRKLGLYVQANSNEDPAILTSSGFHAASLTRIRGPLPKAVIAAVGKRPHHTAAGDG